MRPAGPSEAEAGRWRGPRRRVRRRLDQLWADSATRRGQSGECCANERGCLIVAAALVAAAVPVLLLIHNRHSGYDEALERQAELERQQRQAIAQQRAAQPVVHNHVHLHGVDAATVAAAINQRHHDVTVDAAVLPQPYPAVTANLKDYPKE